MIRGVIIGHGDFAEAMVNTAERIVGKQALVEIISNIGFSCEQLNQKIKEVLDRDAEHESIIFVDLPGGSCTISCYSLLKNDKAMNIICGTNLPIIIEFFMLRDKYSAQELLPILIKKGKENIFQL